jgi:hypothetical protein
MGGRLLGTDQLLSIFSELAVVKKNAVDFVGSTEVKNCKVFIAVVLNLCQTAAR